MGVLLLNHWLSNLVVREELYVCRIKTGDPSLVEVSAQRRRRWQSHPTDAIAEIRRRASARVSNSCKPNICHILDCDQNVISSESGEDISIHESGSSCVDFNGRRVSTRGWCHFVETLSLKLARCVGESIGHRWIPNAKRQWWRHVKWANGIKRWQKGLQWSLLPAFDPFRRVHFAHMNYCSFGENVISNKGDLQHASRDNP